jgi:hypothetical protein
VERGVKQRGSVCERERNEESEMQGERRRGRDERASFLAPAVLSPTAVLAMPPGSDCGPLSRQTRANVLCFIGSHQIWKSFMGLGLSWLTRGNISPWTIPAPAAQACGRSLESALLSEGQIRMQVGMGRGGHQSSTGGHHLRSGPRIPCCQCGRRHRTTSWSESRIPCADAEGNQGSFRHGTSCSPDSSQSRLRCRGGGPPSCRCPLENRPCDTLLGWVRGFRPIKKYRVECLVLLVGGGLHPGFRIQGFDGATASICCNPVVWKAIPCTFTLHLQMCIKQVLFDVHL